MKNRKGIILAGGTGSRLFPITEGVSKQLLPVYDKPMVYYPLSVLMLSGIREIAIITNPEYLKQFKCLMGDGSFWGLRLTYIKQPSPDGLAQAYILAEKFLNGSPSAMILGDNFFYGGGFKNMLAKAMQKNIGGTAFGYRVSDPKRYGVVNYDMHGKVQDIEEKPKNPKSDVAVTGLYFLDNTASEKAKRLKLSKRGEFEITSLLKLYLREGQLDVKRMGRGYAWLDTGTFESMIDAGNFVRTLQARQGLQVGCPEEIAFENKWISKGNLLAAGEKYGKNDYGKYLIKLAKNSGH